MDNVIESTKDLINTLDSSDLISNLDYYKERVINDINILELITKYNNSNDDYEKMSLKKEIYKNDDYVNYMKYYNELFFYVIKINNMYKKFTSNKGC